MVTEREGKKKVVSSLLGSFFFLCGALGLDSPDSVITNRPEPPSGLQTNPGTCQGEEKKSEESFGKLFNNLRRPTRHRLRFCAMHYFSVIEKSLHGS